MVVTKSFYRDSLLSDRRLRRKDDAVDDPSTYAEQYDPGAIFAVVGGVADAGNLTFSLAPLDTGRYYTPAPVVAVMGVSLALGAAALAAAIDAALLATSGTALDLNKYIMRTEYTAAGAGVRIIPNPTAPAFLPTMTGTGGTTTLTFTPDDTFPITAVAAKQAGDNTGMPPTHVIMSVYSVSSANDVNGIGSCTFDLQGLRVVDRFDNVANAAHRPAVEDEGTLTGLLLGEPVEMPLGGGRWGVRMTNIASAPSGHDAFAVHYREVVR